MKLSNRLLIAFALALILIPVLGMVIVSATQYKTGSYKDVVQKIGNFSTPTKNMLSVAMASPFESVNVADGKSLALNIHLIKDDKFGVKIQNDFKDLVSATVDANGQLQIVVKDQIAKEGTRNRHYTQIYIYAPNIKSLSTFNADDLIITSTADSLNIDAKKVRSVSFDDETHIKQLNLKATGVEYLTFRKDDIKSIKLDLVQTKLNIEDNSFENASITTLGACEVIIGSSNNEAKNQTINDLMLNTNGVTDLRIENTTINTCSGKLSDETKVSMPAVNINQMYKR